MALATSDRCCLAWKRSTIWMASGNCSVARFQIHLAPSPSTAWRAARSKPRRAGLAHDARRKLARHLVGVPLRRALDGGRVGDRARVADRRALLVAPLGAPDGDELDLARLRRAVGLLARAPLQLRVAHRHAGAVHAQVQRRRDGSSAAGGSTTRRSSSAISRPSASAARSTCLVGTSTPASSRSNSWPSSKLTIAPTRPTMRSTPGESDPPSRPSARSRGQKPVSHGSQW